jgi:hypothetical protein
MRRKGMRRKEGRGGLTFSEMTRQPVQSLCISGGAQLVQEGSDPTLDPVRFLRARGRERVLRNGDLER